MEKRFALLIKFSLYSFYETLLKFFFNGTSVSFFCYWNFNFTLNFLWNLSFFSRSFLTPHSCVFFINKTTFYLLSKTFNQNQFQWENKIRLPPASSVSECIKINSEFDRFFMDLWCFFVFWFKTINSRICIKFQLKNFKQFVSRSPPYKLFKYKNLEEKLWRRFFHRSEDDYDENFN